MFRNAKTFFKDLQGFFLSKYLYIALLKIGGLIILLGGGFFMLLSTFTNHGESVKLDNYVGGSLKEVQERADDEGFDLKIIDSIHVVGKPGGVVLTQQPLAGSEVKQSRTIYLTITKYRPDHVKLASLPLLYGREFASTQKFLKQSFQIESEILSYEFDEGPENHILAAIYKNDTIDNAYNRKNDVFLDKGSKIQFIVSKNTDEKVKIPDLICKSYDAAIFLLNSSMLKPGTIIMDKTVTNKSLAFVYKQNPIFQYGKTLMHGDTVTIYLTQNPPPQCQNND